MNRLLFFVVVFYYIAVCGLWRFACFYFVVSDNVFLMCVCMCRLQMMLIFFVC